jgi:ABC-type dipeptide/oligopeptide/nickel transport system ATPase component
MNDCALSIDALNVEYRSSGKTSKAVDGVSLVLRRGEILGIAGESGSGKSTVAKSILRLLPTMTTTISGRIVYQNEDLLSLDDAGLRRIRGIEIAMVFQNPSAAFNPVLPVGLQIGEILERTGVPPRERERRVASLLGDMGIASPEYRMRQYPHEFSGGMLQRAMIAMALSRDPKILIADEPTSGLDATTQAQLIQLVRRIKGERDLSILWISHDLGVLGALADRVAVMKEGRVVELGETLSLYRQPKQPYTRGLLDALGIGSKERPTA